MYRQISKFFVLHLIFTFTLTSYQAAAQVVRPCWVPWFSSEKKEQAPSFDWYLAKEFSKKIGYVYQPRMVKWPELFETLLVKNIMQANLFATDQCDLYSSNITQSPDREKFIDIVPFYSGRSFIIVNSALKNKVLKPQDLANLKTSVKPSTTYEKALEEIEKKYQIKTIRINSQASSLEMLESKTIDFLIMDVAMALFVNSTKSAKLNLAFPIGDIENIGWGFPKNNSTLKTKFIKFLEQDKANGYQILNGVYSNFFGVNYVDFENVIISSI